MREYGKISPQYWIGKTGKALRAAGMESQLVGLYLMSNPHANMLGLYYLPKSFIAHETGMTMQGASKGLASCIEAGFCRYDDSSEIVWVIEMAHYQIAPRLNANDKQCKGVQSAYDSVPENPFLEPFFDKYEPDFHLTRKRVIEAPCKPLRSKEKEQEQEKEQAKEQTIVELKPDVLVGPNDEERRKNAVDLGARRDSPRGDVGTDVRAVFVYWQQVMGHARAQLDEKREKAIKARLKNGYSVADLCRAVDGCAKSPHHMGQNESRTIYDDIELICRDGPKVDGFIKKAGVVPGSMSPGLQAQVDILQDWMNEG